MTDNILAGLQFSTKMPGMPDFLGRKTDTWSNWVDTDGKVTSYPANTKFRVKPSFGYTVSSQKGIAAIQDSFDFNDKDAMMKHVATKLDGGFRISISPTPHEQSITAVVAGRNIQYRLGKDNWTTLYGIATELVFSGPLKFRIRPDFYHVVDSLDPVSKGSISFHDIDDLAKYVDDRIRTNGLDFSIKKVWY